MEHRMYKRASLTMDVAIHRYGVGTLTGNSLDISRNGIFVKIDPSTLFRNTMVEVEFIRCTLNKSNITPRRALAIVVRLAVQGVGLMFANEVNFIENKEGAELLHECSSDEVRNPEMN